MLLVVFVRPPPVPFARWRTQARYVDWRPALLALALFILFLIMTRIPLAQQLFLIGPLRQPDHYLVIGIAVLAWAVTVRFVWWIVPLIPVAPRRL